MSSVNPRPPVRRPSSKDRKGPTFSPWHFIGLGMIALLGTGVVAALDRSQQRAASSQAEPLPRKGASAQNAPAMPPAEAAQAPLAQVPSTTATIASPLRPQAAQAATLTADGAAASPRPADAAKPAVAAPAPMQAMIPASALRAQGDGPTVTASLSAPPAPERPPVSPAPQAAATAGAVKTSTGAPTDCLPEPLRGVLSDLAARFGGITVVSTHQLNTVNHSSGSIREKLHHDCKAVDIRAERSRIDEIKAYLRTRREVGGLESYRNGIIHIDVSGTAVAGAARPRARPAQAQAAAETAAADAMQAAAPQQAAPAPSPFTPVVRDRDR